MRFYTDYGQIIGIRILNKVLHSDEYNILYEFKGTDWQERCLQILSEYIGLKDVKIQTLHPFSTSLHLQTGLIHEPGDIWLDNPYFTID